MGKKFRLGHKRSGNKREFVGWGRVASERRKMTERKYQGEVGA